MDINSVHGNRNYTYKMNQMYLIFSNQIKLIFIINK